MSNTEIATVDAAPVVAEYREERSIEEVAAQVQKVAGLVKKVMQDDVHFGIIPGTKKQTLYKQGAEKICLLFNLRAVYRIERIDLPGGHREYSVICDLSHRQTLTSAGEGVGSCSSMETKYRWRKISRVCPDCGEAAIIKGKKEYGGGWVCFKKKGGCGAKWDDGADQAQEFETTEEGRAENPDIADVYNTVLKIAKKRAYVDATITVGAVSDMFTQDIEDFAPEPREAPPATTEELSQDALAAINVAAETAYLLAQNPATDAKIATGLLKFTGLVLDAYAHGKDPAKFAQAIIKKATKDRPDPSAPNQGQVAPDPVASEDAAIEKELKTLHTKTLAGLKVLSKNELIDADGLTEQIALIDNFLAAGNEKGLREVYKSTQATFDASMAKPKAAPEEAPSEDDIDIF